MPKMLIHAPWGTFDAPARQQVAQALTSLGLACEGIPQSPFVQSTVWIYFLEYAPDAVFMGAQPAYRKFITLQVYAIEGGLQAEGKRRLIEGATAVFRRYAGAGTPAYVVIHDMAEQDWGIFGRQADLAALRASPMDAPSI